MFASSVSLPPLLKNIRKDGADREKMKSMVSYVQFEQFMMVITVRNYGFEIIIKSFAFNA